MSTYFDIKKKLGNAELVAVSKTHPVEKILELYRAGQKIFGENYVQELVAKKKQIDALGISDLEFHFIGRLQTNKIKLVLPCVTTVHSVDSLRIYEEIIKRADSLQKPLSIYFQINIDEEDSKGGFEVSDLDALALRLTEMNSKWVKPIGLMCIPDPERDHAVAYRAMKTLSLKYAKTFGTGLSMGMSNDFEEALVHGATSVRIGSAIFGPRL
jgi:pyridoxal phosphate enzyme (YggS family)